MGARIPSHGRPETRVFELIGVSSPSDSGLMYVKRQYDAKNVGWDTLWQPGMTQTPTPSITPTYTPTNTVTMTVTPSVTPTETPAVTPTPTPSVTSAVTPTPESTTTPTPSVTAAATSTPTPTSTAEVTPTPTETPPVTPTVTPSVTPISLSPTPTNTVTPTATPLYFLNLEGGPYIAGSGYGYHAAGDNVVLTAFPGEGNHFTAWIGAGPHLLPPFTITDNPTTVVMPASNLGIFIGNQEDPTSSGLWDIELTGSNILWYHGTGSYASGSFKNIYVSESFGYMSIGWTGSDASMGTLVRDDTQNYNTVRVPSSSLSGTISLVAIIVPVTPTPTPSA